MPEMTTAPITFWSSIYFRDPEIDHALISSRLGVGPCRTWRKGDPSTTNPRANVRLLSTGGWVFDANTSDREEDSSLSDNLNRLWAVLGSHTQALAELHALYPDSFLDIVVTADNTVTPAFEVSVQDLGILSALRLPVQFTVYQAPDEDMIAAAGRQERI